MRADAAKLEQQHASDKAALADVRESLEAARLDARNQVTTHEHLRSELAATHRQRESLQLALSQAQLALEAERVGARGTAALLEQRLASRADEDALRAQVWQAQKAQLDDALRLSQATASELSGQLALKNKSDASTAAVDLVKMQELCEELDNEKSRSSALEQQIAAAQEAASTLLSRYQKKLLVRFYT